MKEKRTKKCRAEKKKTEKHCLDDDSEDEFDALKSKYCVGHHRFGNSNLNAFKKDEMKKLRRFIEEESDESKCKDVDEDEKPLWLKRAEMKAMDDTLINGKEIQLQVAEGQRQLNEMRCAEKWQKHHDALLKVRRDNEIRSACAISNSNNNIMNNSNNTNSTSHDNSTTTTSSNVNNSNKSMITTTTSTNNSGDSNCNNTHNININILDAGLNSHQGLSLQEFNDLFAFQRNMPMNDLHHQSLGMYQVHHHRQGQGHQPLGMYHGHADPFFYNPTVSLPMLLAMAGMFSSVSQSSLNVCLDLLYHNFAIRCTGSCTANWLSSFKQARSIYLAGGSLC
jgi:hypothetical protein